MDSGLNRLSKFINGNLLLVILLAFFLYSAMFVARRSFWIDESMVALALVNSELSPFVPTTLYNQVAPWGFMLITRLSQIFFGAGDLQFRLPGLVFYTFGMIILARYLKQRFNLATASAITIAMLANPLLLQYSTEFKPYVYEFTFAILVLVSFLKMEDGDSHAFRVYSASILLSIFFSISTVFIIGAVFLIEGIKQVRMPPKEFFTSRWFILHLVYGILFLAWYMLSITPNLRFNLMNYPHIYSVDLGPDNLTNLAHWGKVLVNAILSMLVPQSILFLLCLIGLLFNPKHEKSPSNKAFLIIPILVYGLIYAANFTGFYPILIDRHLLYTLPVFYLLFAYSLNNLISCFNHKMLKAAAPAVLIVMAMTTLAIHHLNNKFFFQELKPVLTEIQPDDDVFIYFTAQPGYDWYKLTQYPELPEPLNTRVNPASGPRLPIEDLASDLSERIMDVGAWPAMAYLTQTDDAYLYDEDYLGEMIKEKGNSLLLISHRSGKLLREYLQEPCEIERVISRRGASIFSVSCVVD